MTEFGLHLNVFCFARKIAMLFFVCLFLPDAQRAALSLGCNLCHAIQQASERARVSEKCV